MAEKKNEGSKPPIQEDSLTCYQITREKILKDMSEQADRFLQLQGKVTRKLVQGVRRYKNDSV